MEAPFLQVDPLISFATNNGIAVVMVIVMWRYIRNETQDMADALEQNTETLNNLHSTLQRIEMLQRTATMKRTGEDTTDFYRGGKGKPEARNGD